LLHFRGFRDPMLAGDLIHAKLAKRCGVQLRGFYLNDRAL
jgi:hypothetical protein